MFCKKNNIPNMSSSSKNNEVSSTTTSNQDEDQQQIMNDALSISESIINDDMEVLVREIGEAVTQGDDISQQVNALLNQVTQAMTSNNLVAQIVNETSEAFDSLAAFPQDEQVQNMMNTMITHLFQNNDLDTVTNVSQLVPPAIQYGRFMDSVIEEPEIIAPHSINSDEQSVLQEHSVLEQLNESPSDSPGYKYQRLN